MSKKIPLFPVMYGDLIRRAEQLTEELSELKSLRESEDHEVAREAKMRSNFVYRERKTIIAMYESIENSISHYDYADVFGAYSRKVIDPDKEEDD